MYKRRRRKSKLKKFVYRIVFFMLVAIALFLFGLIFINSRIMPAVMEVAKIHSQNRVNHAINSSMSAFVEQNALVASDFYTNSEMPRGFSINTVLINQICAQLAVDITDLLAEQRREVISVPIGMAAGIDIIAALGPAINVTVVPMGNALVDFETSFTSVGINQVNFQVWLNIESTIGLVTPLQNRRITMTRRVALVDTVYSGEIPHFYFSPR